MSRSAKQPAQPAKPTTSSAKTPLNQSWKDRLHPEDYEQLKATFDLFDIDRSGTIDPEEINKIMEELGEGRKGTFIYNMIEGLKLKNKPINFDEFIDLVCPKVGDVKTKEGLKTLFRLIDKDEDDYINYDELKNLSKIAGDSINDEEILEMLHSIHINHKTNTNEGIYFEEFYQIVTKYYKARNQWSSSISLTHSFKYWNHKDKIVTFSHL